MTGSINCNGSEEYSDGDDDNEVKQDNDYGG